DADAGDMTLRLRPGPNKKSWEALVRLSPRPNATRAWRVVNIPGALNAAVAQAMVHLSDPHPDDVVLNIAGGSGTIAIERALYGKAQQIMLCDVDTVTLDAARSNIQAAALSARIDVYDWNAMDMPVSPGSVDVILADLPFGNLVGSHRDNIELYPALLKECARVCKRGGKFIFITHEIKLMDAVIRDNRKWNVAQSMQITLSGLHPRIYVLLRS
ncbi:MAG: methyltransferase domain-containing protein, partial [Chloroflexota bacterium]